MPTILNYKLINNKRNSVWSCFCCFYYRNLFLLILDLVVLYNLSISRDFKRNPNHYFSTFVAIPYDNTTEGAAYVSYEAHLEAVTTKEFPSST